MSRLIVVSNRVAPVDEGKKSAGGLAVALLSALRQAGGVWFGWSGEVTANPSHDPKITRVGNLMYAQVDLSRRDYEEYYNGYANSTLWPLFHYRLDLTSFARRTFEGYQRVNQLFASRLRPLVGPNDVIWVHDYHLMPMAEQLRQMGLNNRMGFFLHTPWPAPEIMLALPAHETLVRSLCAYDVVGFHTVRDVRAFTNYIQDEARGHVSERSNHCVVRAFGRSVFVRDYPISIDTAGLEALAAEAANARQTQRLQESMRGRDLIIGVDRLDYSKGLPQRFEAFEYLLKNYAGNRGRVSLMQIAPPSRTGVAEYKAIRRELEGLAGHINGSFSEFDWVPIRYLNKSFTRRTLAGFFRVSRIGLVTPLRDGMNLVAKEYLACQDPADPGVLVLSRFAGAALELDSALIVNPYDIEGVAESMQRGLTMSLEERRERHAAAMDVLRRNDITAWKNAYVGDLMGSAA